MRCNYLLLANLGSVIQVETRFAAFKRQQVADLSNIQSSKPKKYLQIKARPTHTENPKTSFGGRLHSSSARLNFALASPTVPICGSRHKIWGKALEKATISRPTLACHWHKRCGLLPGTGYDWI